MRVSIIIILFLCSAILLGGCKKYEEDPFISFRSPRARIEGGWDLRKVTINGVDSTSQYFAYGNCSLQFPGGGNNQETMYLGECYTHNNSYSSSKWSFGINNTIHMSGVLIGYYLPGYIATTDYDILRLYGKKFKIRAMHPQNGKEYILEYRKQ